MTTSEVQRQLLNRKLVEYNSLKREVEKESVLLSRLEDGEKHLLQSIQITQEAAEAVQQSAHSQVVDIVSRCLKAVFGEKSPEFRIVFEKKRGKTEARLAFLKDGHEMHPENATAGGGLDVAAFALRMASLILSRPQKRRLLVLDEPMRMLSKNFRPACAEMLMELSKELETQIIMVSHDEEFQVGKVIQL